MDAAAKSGCVFPRNKKSGGQLKTEGHYSGVEN